MLQTVEKSGKILDLFDSRHPEWGVNEVARALGLSKGSACDQLATLTEIGLLRRTPSHRYRLGWRVFSLYRVLRTTTDFCLAAQPFAEELANQLDVVVNITALSRGRVVRVGGALPNAAQGFAKMELIGLERPAHATSAGKILLAYQPWSTVQEVIDAQGGARACTPQTLTDLAVLQAELDRVREQGYAYDLEESVPKQCCIGVPLCTADGEVVAAMSLLMSSERFRQVRDHHRVAAMTAAGQITRILL